MDTLIEKNHTFKTENLRFTCVFILCGELASEKLTSFTLRIEWNCCVHPI